jgi:EAL domain-containing protein (putative c-di-GMP-specific phosphodiesterase class I)
MVDPTAALQVLEQLAETGVALSIDDFGTGYSSLAYLRRLPVEEVKIDRSFVRHMASEEGDHVIVRSTIDLASNLGLTVVAEGVEDGETLEQLAGLGCNEAQGYFISRPLPAADLSAWLRRDPAVRLSAALGTLAAA